MTTITSDSLPWLAKPSTGYDLFSRPPPERSAARPQPSPNDGEAEAGPKRIIAHRGTEIFVGKGNEVRCADLQDLKARQPASAQEGYRQFKVRGGGFFFRISDFRFSVFGFAVANGDGDRRWIYRIWILTSTSLKFARMGCSWLSLATRSSQSVCSPLRDHQEWITPN